jgi:hypothetical protein
MAIGDLKGDECIVVTGTCGVTLTKGQVVHLESDGFWDSVVDTDTGKFGVAIEAAATGETSEVRVCIWGPVETTAWGAAIKAGAVAMAATTGCVITTDNGAVGENVGTAMTAFDSSGVGTLFVGLVG